MCSLCLKNNKLHKWFQNYFYDYPVKILCKASTVKSFIQSGETLYSGG